jgi:DNA-binding GntR family transcriptional regulator
LSSIVETGTPLLKEQLAAQLKETIVDGRLRPGQRVVEAAWAREFGVAQASVREAINLLIADGFLVKSAGRSARVPQYTKQDIDRIYEVRGALEGLAARLAAAAQADLAPLEAALDRMAAAAARGDVKKLIESDLAFHLALVEASANPVLIEMLGRLLRPLFTFVLLRMMETHESTAGWQPDMPRHRQILSLIRDSSPALAGQFVEHCVGRFAASAHAIWAPEPRSRGNRRKP